MDEQESGDMRDSLLSLCWQRSHWKKSLSAIPVVLIFLTNFSLYSSLSPFSPRIILKTRKCYCAVNWSLSWTLFYRCIIVFVQAHTWLIVSKLLLLLLLASILTLRYTKMVILQQQHRIFKGKTENVGACLLAVWFFL